MPSTDAMGPRPALQLQLPADMPKQVASDFELSGDWTLPASSDWEVLCVVNGDLKNAQVLKPTRDGDKSRWHLRVDTSRWADEALQRVVLLVRHAQTKAVLTVSEAQEVRMKKDWQLRANIADLVGDDRGRMDAMSIRKTRPMCQALLTLRTWKFGLQANPCV